MKTIRTRNVAGRRWRAAAVATITGITLSACGGGGDGSPATPASKTSEPAPTQTCASLLVAGTPLTPKCHVTVAWDGDSDNFGEDPDSTYLVQSPTVGAGMTGRANPAPSQMLQAYFDATFGAGVVGVIDISIPGSTLRYDIDGTNTNSVPLATRLANLPVHADIVATNDEINSQYVLGLNYQQFTADIQQWIGVVASYGGTPVYLEPNPIGRSDANFMDPEYGTTALVYNADQAFANAGYPALGNLNEWYDHTSPPNAQPWNIAWLSSDLTHCSQAGFAQKVSNYFYGVPNLMGSTYSLKQIVTNMLGSRPS
jgi:hypothetical protein